MPRIEWRKGEPPVDKRGQRLLMIAVVEPPYGVIGDLPEIVIGHWHEQNEKFVATQPGGYARTRIGLFVKYWADIPDLQLPEGVEIRPLELKDTKG
jgi:hypothetical protein